MNEDFQKSQSLINRKEEVQVPQEGGLGTTQTIAVRGDHPLEKDVQGRTCAQLDTPRRVPTPPATEDVRTKRAGWERTEYIPSR